MMPGHGDEHFVFEQQNVPGAIEARGGRIAPLASIAPFLLADAGHNLGDVLALLVAGIAMLLVKRAARHERGGWWLESDNPAAGAVDSRAFGAVPADLIEGRVLLVYWPLRGR